MLDDLKILENSASYYFIILRLRRNEDLPSRYSYNVKTP